MKMAALSATVANIGLSGNESFIESADVDPYLCRSLHFELSSSIRQLRAA
jgi:hypothetical protein